MLFSLDDGAQVEAVRLKYRRGWQSFCVSAQCGCGLGCRFCATGAGGLVRNLTADELTDQLLYFHLRGCELDSVSFMGMGEPLANPAMFDALRDLTDPSLFGLSRRKITLSTVGVIPGIRRMTREFPQVNLAFSLHSPFERQRSALMPVNRCYPLGGVLDALDEHIGATGRRVFLAYLLLHGINDTPDHAAALSKLALRSPLYHVDLIPYNATGLTAQRFAPSDHARVAAFYRHLRRDGVGVTIRAQFGADIDAACGQLRGEPGQTRVREGIVT